MSKEKIQHPGECPKCGNEHMEYGVGELQDDQFVFPVECFECGYVGKEWNKLEFAEYTDDEDSDYVDVYNENDDDKRDDDE